MSETYFECDLWCMSRRELAALGITINTNDTTGISNSNSIVANTGTVETFTLYLHLENINASIVQGRKLYLAATKELGKEERIGISIENRQNVKNHLETLSLKYSWSLIISKVPDANGVEKDIIKYYKNLTNDDTLAFNNTCLVNGAN